MYVIWFIKVQLDAAKMEKETHGLTVDVLQWKRNDVGTIQCTSR